MWNCSHTKILWLFDFCMAGHKFTMIDLFTIPFRSFLGPGKFRPASSGHPFFYWLTFALCLSITGWPIPSLNVLPNKEPTPDWPRGGEGRLLCFLPSAGACDINLARLLLLDDVTFIHIYIYI